MSGQWTVMQRKKLEVDEFFDPKKIRVVMGAMFLKAWTYIAENEHTFDLPLLVHYSSIDKVRFMSLASEAFLLDKVHWKAQEQKLDWDASWSGQIVYPPATERFARNVASKDVTLRPFDKFAHDLYLDTSKANLSPMTDCYSISIHAQTTFSSRLTRVLGQKTQALDR